MNNTNKMDVEFTPAKTLDLHRSRRVKLLAALITLLLNCYFLIMLYFNSFYPKYRIDPISRMELAVSPFYPSFIFYNLCAFMLIILNTIFEFNITLVRMTGLLIFISTVIYSLLYIVSFFI